MTRGQIPPGHDAPAVPRNHDDLSAHRAALAHALAIETMNAALEVVDLLAAGGPLTGTCCLERTMRGATEVAVLAAAR